MCLTSLSRPSVLILQIFLEGMSQEKYVVTGDAEVFVPCDCIPCECPITLHTFCFRYCYRFTYLGSFLALL